MLTLSTKHGLFDPKVKVVGDVNYHHTVEDTGIVLGHHSALEWHAGGILSR